MTCLQLGTNTPIILDVFCIRRLLHNNIDTSKNMRRFLLFVFNNTCWYLHLLGCLFISGGLTARRHVVCSNRYCFLKLGWQAYGIIAQSQIWMRKKKVFKVMLTVVFLVENVDNGRGWKSRLVTAPSKSAQCKTGCKQSEKQRRCQQLWQQPLAGSFRCILTSPVGRTIFTRSQGCYYVTTVFFSIRIFVSGRFARQ